MTDNNKDKSNLDAFDDVLFSSDEELAQRKAQDADSAVEKASQSPDELAASQAADKLREDAERDKIAARDKAREAVRAAAKALNDAESAAELAQDVEIQLAVEDHQADSIPLQADSIPLIEPQPVKAQTNTPAKAVVDEHDDAVEGALFSSDEELEHAMDAMDAKETKGTTVAKAEAKLPERPAAEAEQAAAPDFEPFLAGDEHITLLQAQAASAPGLAITTKRLNTSLVADVDWPVPELLDEELLEEFQQFRLKKQQEKERRARELAEKPDSKKALFKKLYRNNRERVDEYLGRSLPNRTVALNFKFPPHVSVKEVAVLLTGKQIQDIFAKKKESLLTIFKKSDRALESITLRELSASKQQHLLDAFYPHLIEKTQAFISSSYKNPGIPMQDERQEIAELCVSTIRRAVLAYKQLYGKYYQASNLLYGAKRAQANQTAWCLLELLCLEQHLNTCLYRGHSNNASITFNKVYNVLCEYEEDFVYEPQLSSVFNEALTLQQMFVRFQIDMAFEISGISASLHRRLRAYFSARSALVLPLTAEQLSSAWVDECWIVAHGHEGRARFCSDAPIEDLPAAYIHIEPFLQQLQKDYAQAIDILQKNELRALPKLLDIQAFELLSGAEILQILTGLNQQIVSIEKNLRLPKYTVFKKFEMEVDVFSGFQATQVFFKRWLSDKANAHLGGPDSSSQQEQSVISPTKKRGGNGGYWDVALEDAKGIFLQTAETRLCPTMDVGQLLLLVKHWDKPQDEHQQREQMIPVRISQLERVAANKVIVSAEKLGDSAMSVQLENEQGQSLSALIAVQDGRRRLITDMQWSFRSGDKFTMILPNGVQTEISIAALQSVSAAMQVFSIY